MKAEDIDWSKAPEGATHFHPARDASCNDVFWRVEDDVAREVWIVGCSLDHINGHYVYGPEGNGCYIQGECIERPKEMWNGEGLPPVGIVCEWKEKSGFQWVPAEVLFVSEQSVVLRRFDGFEWQLNPKRLSFRPIKTQEQIEAEEREEAIIHMYKTVEGRDSFTRLQVAKLYDAGYRLTKSN